MSWNAPFAVQSVAVDEYHWDVVVTGVEGDEVARGGVICNIPARCAMMGEITVQPGGTATQRVRVTVILCREALREAKRRGVTSISARVAPSLKSLIARLSPTALDDSRGGHALMAGKLEDYLAHFDRVADEDGTLRSLR